MNQSALQSWPPEPPEETYAPNAATHRGPARTENRTARHLSPQASPFDEANHEGYLPLLELGRGGMGIASLALIRGNTSATSTAFERLAVIKRLRPELQDAHEASARFQHEAQAAACVHHANVQSVYQMAEDSEGPYLVLEYIEGVTLEQLTQSVHNPERRLPPHIACRVALDAARGLSAIHTAATPRGIELSLLHRDITPQNLLVGTDGVARVADFGIAKSILHTFSTSKSCLMGKLPYISPEYLIGEPTDARLDIYSLGICLWQTLSGKKPFQAQSEAQLLRAIREQPVPPLRSVAPDISAALASLVDRACAKEASERFGTAKELALALEALSSEGQAVASHDEVAQLVNHWHAEDLMSLRARIAQTLLDPPPEYSGQKYRTHLGLADPPSPLRAPRPPSNPSLTGERRSSVELREPASSMGRSRPRAIAAPNAHRSLKPLPDTLRPPPAPRLDTPSVQAALDASAQLFETTTRYRNQSVKIPPGKYQTDTFPGSLANHTPKPPSPDLLIPDPPEPAALPDAPNQHAPRPQLPVMLAVALGGVLAGLALASYLF